MNASRWCVLFLMLLLAPAGLPLQASRIPVARVWLPECERWTRAIKDRRYIVHTHALPLHIPGNISIYLRSPNNVGVCPLAASCVKKSLLSTRFAFVRAYVQIVFAILHSLRGRTGYTKASNRTKLQFPDNKVNSSRQSLQRVQREFHVMDDERIFPVRRIKYELFLFMVKKNFSQRNCVCLLASDICVMIRLVYRRFN